MTEISIFEAADLFGKKVEEVLNHETIEPEMFFGYAAGNLPKEAIAQLMMQSFDMEPDGNFTRHEKNLALEFAEAFGPDYAQRLYRFAVLVTKLA